MTYENFVSGIASIPTRALVKECVSGHEYEAGQLTLYVKSEPTCALLNRPEKKIHIQKSAEKAWGQLLEPVIIINSPPPWEVEEEARLNHAIALLPAWFVPRMMTDEWLFGLLTAQGMVLVATHIRKLHQDGAGDIWIDADLAASYENFYGKDLPGIQYFCAPTSRTDVSINSRHIIAAFELADT